MDIPFAMATMNEAQLFWDTQDHDNHGWWLRYTDDHGTEQGGPIDGSENASVEELAETIELESHWCGVGTVRVVRGERTIGSIGVEEDRVGWTAA